MPVLRREITISLAAFCSCPLPENGSAMRFNDLGKMFVHNDDRVLLKVHNLFFTMNFLSRWNSSTPTMLLHPSTKASA